MNIAELAIKKSVITWTLTIVLLVLGYFSYQSLPRLEDPEFAIKTAVVVTPYPGASAEEVEKEVSEKIEKAVQERWRPWGSPWRRSFRHCERRISRLTRAALRSAANTCPFYPSGIYKSEKDFQDLLIGSKEGKLIFLKDVATIRRGYVDPPRNILRFDGKPAIGIAISTVLGGNVVAFLAPSGYGPATPLRRRQGGYSVAGATWATCLLGTVGNCSVAPAFPGISSTMAGSRTGYGSRTRAFNS